MQQGARGGVAPACSSGGAALDNLPMCGERPITESQADRHRDPAVIARCARIAARIFERRQVAFSTAHREGGWSNATWSAGGLVLRIALEAGGADLRREARLASLLPPQVGYPEIVETGVTEGLEWMLARQVAGHNLGEVWPVLDWGARATALRGLWARAQAIHAVDASLAAAYARSESPFYAPDAARAAAQLARLQGAGLLTSAQVAALSRALDSLWAALSLAPRVLNHGDLCPENALWKGGRVVALLDLEFAVVAPVELDLNELVKVAYAPPEIPDPLPDPGGSGCRCLRKVVTDIAVAGTSAAGSAERLLGFAILLEMWALEKWLSEWDGCEPYVDWQPYRTLTALADGSGGYLAPVLAQLAAAQRAWPTEETAQEPRSVL
jgi:aminoglycoside phosphotransferase